MGKNNRKFVIDLEITTKDAEKQFDSAAKNIKNKLASIGDAADKMKVFKDVAEYIGDIDAELDKLKSIKGLDFFNKTFGDLDKNLKHELESVFNTTSDNLKALDQLRTKFDGRTKDNTTKDEAKALRDEIVELYNLIGAGDKIDISNKLGVENMLKKSKEALESFAIVWEDVNKKIFKGVAFGAGAGAGDGGPEKLSAELQAEVDRIESEIDELDKLKKRYKKVTNDFEKAKSSVNEIVKGDEYAPETSIDGVQKLMDEFNSLQKQLQTGKKDTVEYYQALNKFAEVAVKLHNSRVAISNDDDLEAQFRDVQGKDKMYELYKIAGSRANTTFNQRFDIKGDIDSIEAFIAAKREEIEVIKQSNNAHAQAPQIDDRYGKLEKKIRDYISAKEELSSKDVSAERSLELEDKLFDLEYEITQLDGLGDKVDEVYKTLEDFINLDMTEMDIKNVLTNLSNLLGITIPQDVQKAGNAISGTLVDELEYVQNLGTRIEKLFNNINSMSGTLEHKVLINGQDIAIKKGDTKEVSAQTSVESYLGTLDKNTIVTAHNHPGGASSNLNAFDFEKIMTDVYSGVAKVGAIISESDITTLNLANIELEDARQVLEKIKSLNVSSLPADKINEFFASLNPAYANVVQTWNPSQFDDLAQFIYDVGIKSGSAVEPLTKFKNVLMAATNGKINLDKYADLFDDFTPEKATDIFNQIMKGEGKDLKAENLSTRSLNEFVDMVEKQKQSFVELRNTADVTYSDIHSMIKKYADDVASGGFGGDEQGFLNKYFDRDDYLKISDWLVELENGEASINQITNRIASHFSKIDPDDFLKDDFSAIDEIVEDTNKMDAAFEEVENKLKEFEALTDKVGYKSFYDASDNVEIGKYIQLLDDAKSALDELGRQGLLTSDQLESVNDMYNEAIDHLQDETKHYTGYGNGDGYYYDSYEDEYRAEQEENRQLREDISDFIDQTNELRAENDKLRDQLSRDTGDADVDESYSDEIAQLEKLEVKLKEVKEAIDLKTQAFREEADTVGNVVRQEIMALDTLSTYLDTIYVTINSIIDGLNRINNTKLNDIQNSDSKVVVDGNNTTSNKEYAYNTTLLETNRILGDILTATRNDDDMLGLVAELEGAVTELRNVANGIVERQKLTGVDASERINTLDKRAYLAGIATQAVNATSIDDVSIDKIYAAADGLVGITGAVKNAEGIWEGFSLKINDANQAVETSVGKQSLYAKSLNEAASAAENVAAKTKTATGSSITGIEDRYIGLNYRASEYTKDNESSVLYSKVTKTTEQYTKALNELKNAKIALDKAPNDEDLRVAFVKAKTDCQNLGNELKGLLDDYDKFKQKHTNVKDIDAGKYNFDSLEDRKQALQEYVQRMYGAEAKTKDFNQECTELNFTLKNSDGTISNMSASFDKLKTSIGSAAAKADKFESAFSGFIGGVSKEMGKLLRYFTARFGIDELFQAFRTGVQYVRDIDSALTELKKVTSETDATYERFLQTASKTAGVVGSTVAELTQMSAEWARLGYNIQEAANLAESTAVLLNVSEFEDAETASEALISTIQAFGYAADDSMHVVDILNEVKVTCLLIQ